jgi:hypothetical protein
LLSTPVALEQGLVQWLEPVLKVPVQALAEEQVRA